MEQITRNNHLMRRKLEKETGTSRKKSQRKVPVRVYVRDPHEVNDLRKQVQEMERLQSLYKERISELESQVCNFSFSGDNKPLPLHKMTLQPDIPLHSSPSTRISSGSSLGSDSSADSDVTIPVKPALGTLAHSQQNDQSTYRRLTSRPHPDRTRLLALYDYVPQPDHHGRLSFKEGDVLLLVSMKSRSGWWQAELNGQIGKIPSNYVEQLDPSRFFKARVIRNFDATQPGDMSIQRGSFVTILKRQDNGWYLGEKGGASGFFPSSCVERISTPTC